MRTALRCVKFLALEALCVAFWLAVFALIYFLLLCAQAFAVGFLRAAAGQPPA